MINLYNERIEKWLVGFNNDLTAQHNIISTDSQVFLLIYISANNIRYNITSKAHFYAFLMTLK